MPVIYRYLLTCFLGAFANVLGVFIGLFTLLDGVEQIRRFSGKAGVQWSDLVLFLLLRLPEFLLQFVAPMGMLATVFALTRLVRQNEITALRASGLSIYRILIPFLLGGAIVAGVQMAMQDQAIPRLDPISSNLYEYLKSDGRVAMATAPESLWIRDGQQIVHATRVLARERVLRGVTILGFDREFQLVERYEAQGMTWRDGRWLLENGVHYRFQPASLADPFSEKTWPGHLSEEQLDRSQRHPTALSLAGLREHIDILRQEGYPTTHYQVTLQRRLADPATTLTAILLAFPFSLRLQRFGGSSTTQLAGLALGFALFFLVDLSTALGMGSRLPPILAAWGPTAFFCGFGAFLLMHLEEEAATPRQTSAPVS